MLRDIGRTDNRKAGRWARRLCERVEQEHGKSGFQVDDACRKLVLDGRFSLELCMHSRFVRALPSVSFALGRHGGNPLKAATATASRMSLLDRFSRVRVQTRKSTWDYLKFPNGRCPSLGLLSGTFGRMPSSHSTVVGRKGM